jgi:hypothetical protein
MANIFAILPGFNLDVNAMSLGELMSWHEKALKRNGSGK